MLGHRLNKRSKTMQATMVSMTETYDESSTSATSVRYIWLALIPKYSRYSSCRSLFELLSHFDSIFHFQYASSRSTDYNDLVHMGFPDV